MLNRYRHLAMGLVGAALCAITNGARAEDILPATPTPDQSFEAGTLHVDKFGKGDHALVLIPGLAGGSWVWAGTIAKWSPDYTIYAISLPGFDGRPAAKEQSLFAAFKRDFWDMLSKQKIQKPVIIGHSLGGTLAIALGEEHPDRLSGIIAADGMPVFPALANVTAEQRKTMAAQLAGVYATMSNEDLFPAMKSYMSSIGTNKPDMVEPTARLMARGDPKAIAAWTQEDISIDLRPDLAKLTSPLLVIVPYDSSEAKQFSMTTAKQKSDFYLSILKGSPHAEVAAISSSLHFIMLDQPDAFQKAVAVFLSSIHW
jgi:pimeloyl-ACP methyl ester carboxylesterase